MVQLVANDGPNNDDHFFELSELAAQLSITIVNMRDDSDGTPIKVPTHGSAELKEITELLTRTAKLLEELKLPDARRGELIAKGLPRGAALDDELRAATRAALDELGVTNDDEPRAASSSLLRAARLLRYLNWFDAPLPATILAESVAQLLRGKSAEGRQGLRALLGNDDDLSADEKRAALAEPLFTAPPAPSAEEPETSAPPQPERSFSLTLNVADPIQTCLERCDARTLRELKAVSSAWRRRAREVLGVSTSTWWRQPIWSTSAEGRELVEQLRPPSVLTDHAKKKLLKRMGEELDCKVELAGHADAVVRRLRDSDNGVRRAAVEVLGKLEPEALALHADAVVAKLEDSDKNVRQAATTTLSKLGPAALADALVAKLEHPDGDVRCAVLKMLSKMVEPATLAEHADSIIARMEDDAEKVRDAAAATLAKLYKLDTAVLAGHAGALVAKLEHPNRDVRCAVLKMLGNLEPATLAQHADALVSMLEDNEGKVRRVAFGTLGKLEPATLAQYAATIVAKLTTQSLRSEAQAALGKLKATELARHASAIRAKLNDPNEHVRCAALEVLRKLEAGTLERYAAAIAAKLEDARDVCLAAVRTLGMLKGGVIEKHAAGIVALLAHSDRDVRHAAEKTLGKSGVQRTAAALKEHAAVIVAKLEDSNIRVRHAAVTTLGKMEVCDLDEHASAIIAKLGHSDGGVRWAAVEAMGTRCTLCTHSDGTTSKYSLIQLRPPYAREVVRTLEDSSEHVRREAVATLGTLDLRDLASNAKDIVAMLGHSNEHVRIMALEVLGKLGLGDDETRYSWRTSEYLNAHATAVVDTLQEDSSTHVRYAAATTLGKLDATTLTLHAAAVIA